MSIAAPSQEDVVLPRPGSRARHAGVAPVQNFLFAHTPSVVVYECRRPVPLESPGAHRCSDPMGCTPMTTQGD
ncbi:hypothetical protein ACIBCT_11575 [Streptosporangium sp. NPDC050855]|uniref:hypothetical protein n=1 Tax=Streptosporangium sp. NPDC050855 TaxID=3366194 RepID=UPI003787D018